MNTSTLFSAYVKATRMREICRSNGPSHGISVKQDFWSRQYQRYDRLSCKLESRLRDAIAKVEGDNA